MKYLKFFIVTLVLAGLISVANPTDSRVHAAPKSKTTESSTQTKESGDEDQNGKTLEAGEIKDIDDMSVKMTDDGKLSTSFDGQSDSTRTWNTILKKYRITLVGLEAVATLTFLGFFIFNFCRIGACAENPVERKKAIVGVLWTGLACGGCGCVTVICALFWNILK